MKTYVQPLDSSLNAGIIGSRHCILKGLGHAILGNSLILSIMISKRQIGRARVFHLQIQGHITTENDFPAG